jgi:hypothetical protein
MYPIIGDEIMTEIKRLHADMRQSYRIIGASGNVSQEEIARLRRDLDLMRGTVATMRLSPGYIYYDPPVPGTAVIYTQRNGGIMALEPPEKEWLPPVIAVGRKELRELAEAAAMAGVTSRYGGREIVPYVKPEAEAVTKKKILPSAPPGIHFAPEKRIGDEVKDTYLDHLGDMMSRGFIDNAEYSARVAEVMTAKTREDLEFLVKDLPGMTVREPPEEKSTGFVHLAGAMSIGGWGYVLVMLGVGLLSWTLGIWLVIFFAISLLFCILHTRK